MALRNSIALPNGLTHLLNNNYSPMIKFIYNDGGRTAAGIKATGDCVCRSIAIASGRPYEEVYEGLKHLSSKERRGKRKRGVSDPATGVYRETAKRYIESIGGVWVPVMGIGTGCTMHLKESELPEGRLVVSLSGHYAAVVDRCLHDTHDCSRQGTRCVYGYYVFPNVYIDHE